MKRTFSLLPAGLLLIGLAAWPAAGQEAGDVLTNDDIVRMAQAGLPAAVIVAKIQSSSTDFETSVDTLLALSEAEIAPEILEAMVSANAPAAPSSDGVSGESGSTAAGRAAHFEGTSCEYPGIFLFEGESLVALELTQPTSSKAGSGLVSGLTWGLKSTKAKAMVRGERSPVRTTDRDPTFYFCFEAPQAGVPNQTSGAANPAEILLIVLEAMPRKEQRSFVTGKVNSWRGSSAGTPPKQMRRVDYKEVVPGVCEVQAETLRAGEYAFFDYSGQASEVGAYGGFFGGASGKLFAFGVD